MYPDDLPQSYPVAGKTVQHYRWEFSSPSSNMTATNIRIFNDTTSVNPSNIFVTNIKLTEINKTSDNILGSTTPVGMFAAGNLSGASIVDATNPQTQAPIMAMRLNAGVSAPVAWSPQMSLKINTDYTIEFDYWADADNVAFDADFFPDDLPEVHPVTKTKLQHYK